MANTKSIRLLGRRYRFHGHIHLHLFGFALYQGHLVHQVAGTGELVDGPQHVTDVHADGALQLGLEGDVAAHGLPVAIEGDADEFAVAVDHRAAAVAARDVVVADEAGDQLAVLIGVAAVILLHQQLVLAAGHDEFIVRGVLLLQDAVRRGDVLVEGAVHGHVAAHLCRR
jgi:hypothetical protein